MSVSIINPGVGGITVETDPTALKLTGGAISGDLTVAQKVGIGGVVPVGANNKLAVHNGNIVFTAGFGLAFGDGSTMTSAPNLSGYALLTGANFTGKISCGFGAGGTSINVGTRTGADPSAPTEGDIWIQNDRLRFRSNLINNSVASTNLSNTFTAKQTFTVVSGVAGINIGIGGTDASSNSNGDMWIASGGQTLNYRDGLGSWRQVLTTSTNASITVNSTNTALRVTQTGTGNSFVVEDQTNPDTSCFVIDSTGRVSVNTDANAPLNTYADFFVRARPENQYASYMFHQTGHGLYVSSAASSDSIQASGGPVRVYNGICFGNAGPNIQIPVAPVGGSGTYNMELGMTIAGVNYRFPCRTV